MGRRASYDEIIELAGLSAAAAALCVSRPAVSNMLNGRADLSERMALRLEEAFGARMDGVMRVQSACDIAQARKRQKEGGACSGEHRSLTVAALTRDVSAAR